MGVPSMRPNQQLSIQCVLKIWDGSECARLLVGWAGAERRSLTSRLPSRKWLSHLAIMIRFCINNLQALILYWH